MQLYHNRGFSVNPLSTAVSSLPLMFNFWANVIQGTTREDRIGDKITPRGMLIDMFLANKFNRPNTMHRIIVAILPKEYDGTVMTAAFNPFQPTGTGNRMILAADHDKGVKFLYDKIHRTSTNQAIGAGYPEFNSNTVKEATKHVRLWIKRKKASPIVFNQNLAQIVNRPIAVYVIPYEQFSTLETDNVSSVSARCRIYFKDL